MNKEKLMSYLREKVRNMKNFSGDKLYVRLKRLERVIKAERINGRICNEELEELMMVGYVASQKRVADFSSKIIGPAAFRQLFARFFKIDAGWCHGSRV